MILSILTMRPRHDGVLQHDCWARDDGGVQGGDGMQHADSTRYDNRVINDDSARDADNYTKLRKIT